MVMPELNDSLAWTVAIGAGLLTFLCLVFLTRNLLSWWLKWVLRLLPPVALLLPASVPGQPGFYAPAFIVAPFEAFLQEEGDPAAASARLLLILGSLVGLITLAAVARWLRGRGAANEETSAARTSVSSVQTAD